MNLSTSVPCKLTSNFCYLSGSPFLVNVANHAVVTADGEGLTLGKVNHKSTFVINTSQDTTASNVAVHIECKYVRMYRIVQRVNVPRIFRAIFLASVD